MKPFTRVTGIAAPLLAANIDTDVIMPKQFLKGVDRSGLGDGVLHDLRFDDAGGERPDFILNRSPWRGASFLVTGANFGCGSSREHAVWGLLQYGVRAIVGTTFGSIFFDNCCRNGLLAINLPEAAHEQVARWAAAPASNLLTIDLEQQRIAASSGAAIAFDIEAALREALLSGRDAIDDTLCHRHEIEQFEHRYFVGHSWLRSPASPSSQGSAMPPG